MCGKALDRLLPETRKQAFYYGFGLAFLGGFSIILIVSPLTGLSREFGSWTHDGYLQLARNLSHGNGYVFEPGGAPVTHRPPLIPVLLIPVTIVPPPLQRPVLILLQSLMVGATCYLLFDLASRTLGPRIARRSVLLLLLYPWLFWNVKNPMNAVGQMLFAVLLVNLIARELLLVSGGKDSPGPMSRPLFSLILGLATAAAILTHGTMLLTTAFLLAAMVAIGLWYRKYRTVGVALVAGGVAVVAIAPWTWRNWIVTRHFIPVASNGGYAYFWGNAHWRPQGDVDRRKEPERALRLAGVREKASRVIHLWGIKDPNLDHQINRRMVEDIKAHPRQFARKVALNAVEFYLPITYEFLTGGVRRWDIFALMSLGLSAWHLALWILAFRGFCIQRTTRATLRLLAFVACIVALSAPYLPFLVTVGHSKYALPTMPLLALLAAAGLTRTLPEKNKQQPQSGPSRSILEPIDAVPSTNVLPLPRSRGEKHRCLLDVKARAEAP